MFHKEVYSRLVQYQKSLSLKYPEDFPIFLEFSLQVNSHSNDFLLNSAFHPKTAEFQNSQICWIPNQWIQDVSNALIYREQLKSSFSRNWSVPDDFGNFHLTHFCSNQEFLASSNPPNSPEFRSLNWYSEILWIPQETIV